MPECEDVPDLQSVLGCQCADYSALLNSLRSWAWDHGRTDVVLDLDLHTVAWEFLRSPSRAALVRLAEVLPTGELTDTLETEVRCQVRTGQSGMGIETLHHRLSEWGTQLCEQLATDLSEMASTWAR